MSSLRLLPLACPALALLLASTALAQNTLPTLGQYGKRAEEKVNASCAQLSDSLPPLTASGDDKVTLTADQVDLSQDGLSKLLGAVKLRRGLTEVSANQIDYDNNREVAIINSESLFRSEILLVDSQQAEISFADKSGLFKDNAFTLLSHPARGNSRRLWLSADKTARLADARFTSCAPGNDSWYLEASRIDIDQDKGVGTARNAQLRFQDVPIFYSPWLQFPVDDARHSGMLFPVIADTKRTGIDIRTPLYLNLAPNYDLTLTPRFMSDRGLALNSAGRYLFPRAEGDLGYQVLNHDRATDSRRDYLYWNHEELISRRLALETHYANVSDPTYFEDLGGTIDLSSISYLERSARLTYQAPASYSIQALVQDYQKIASNLVAGEEPYRRLPQLIFNAQTRNSYYHTRAGFIGEFSNFTRSNSVQGLRYDLDPYLKMERDSVAWYSKTQLDYRYTGYALHDTTAGQPQSPSRTLPVLSTEYGLRFERQLADGTPQTLQPQFFYLYVPYRDQSELPVFDSGEPDFDITQLFARNRFSGLDRISDANEFALALTGRQLDMSDGSVKAAVTLGQLYRISAPRVSLPGESPPDSGATDFVGGLDYKLSEHWGTRLQTQWSPADARFSRNAAALRYTGDGKQLFQATYRYRSGSFEQTDLLAITPLAYGFSFSGRWRYSLRDRQSLDTYSALRFDTCCWAVDFAFRRHIVDSQGNFDNGYYIQLELKGLGQLGSGFPNLRVDNDVY